MSVELKGITEGLLFACGEEGVTKRQLAETLEVSIEMVDHLLHELSFDYEHEGRGIMIMQSKEVLHLTTKPEHSHYYKKLLHHGRTSRLTQAALETLAIIAYRQPITKVEIEELRGVNSDYAVRSLLRRSMIESAGRKEAVGRPYFFVTTKDFLTYFGLTSLNDLPDLPENLDPVDADQELNLFFEGNNRSKSDD